MALEETVDLDISPAMGKLDALEAKANDALGNIGSGAAEGAAKAVDQINSELSSIKPIDLELDTTAAQSSAEKLGSVFDAVVESMSAELTGVSSETQDMLDNLNNLARGADVPIVASVENEDDVQKLVLQLGDISDEPTVVEINAETDDAQTKLEKVKQVRDEISSGKGVVLKVTGVEQLNQAATATEKVGRSASASVTRINQMQAGANQLSSALGGAKNEALSSAAGIAQMGESMATAAGASAGLVTALGAVGAGVAAAVAIYAGANKVAELINDWTGVTKELADATDVLGTSLDQLEVDQAVASFVKAKEAETGWLDVVLSSVPVFGSAAEGFKKYVEGMDSTAEANAAFVEAQKSGVVAMRGVLQAFKDQEGQFGFSAKALEEYQQKIDDAVQSDVDAAVASHKYSEELGIRVKAEELGIATKGKSIDLIKQETAANLNAAEAAKLATDAQSKQAEALVAGLDAQAKAAEKFKTDIQNLSKAWAGLNNPVKIATNAADTFASAWDAATGDTFKRLTAQGGISKTFNDITDAVNKSGRSVRDIAKDFADFRENGFDQTTESGQHLVSAFGAFSKAAGADIQAVLKQTGGDFNSVRAEAENLRGQLAKELKLNLKNPKDSAAFQEILKVVGLDNQTIDTVVNVALNETAAAKLAILLPALEELKANPVILAQIALEFAQGDVQKAAEDATKLTQQIVAENPVTASMHINAGPFTAGYQEAKKGAEAPVTTPMLVNAGPFTGGATTAKNNAKTPVTVPVGADTTSAAGSVRALEHEIEQTRNMPVTITVNTSSLRAWEAAHPGLAEGGIVNAASGMYNPPAHIAYRGSIHYAEPETGGEAFIPLALSKRYSAENVLADVAGRFGYTLAKPAAGGDGAGIMALAESVARLAASQKSVQQTNVQANVVARTDRPAEFAAALGQALRTWV